MAALLVDAPGTRCPLGGGAAFHRRARRPINHPLEIPTAVTHGAGFSATASPIGRGARCASMQKRGCRAGWVAPPVPATEEIAMSESTQDRPDKVDEKAPKPGEPDTETVAGQPKKAPESKDGEQQSKQDK
jgi:hypothetical protein